MQIRDALEKVSGSGLFPAGSDTWSDIADSIIPELGNTEKKGSDFHAMQRSLSYLVKNVTEMENRIMYQEKGKMESETIHLSLLSPHLSCKIDVTCLSMRMVHLNLDILEEHC